MKNQQKEGAKIVSVFTLMEIVLEASVLLINHLSLLLFLKRKDLLKEVSKVITRSA